MTTDNANIHQLLQDPRIWQGRQQQAGVPVEPSGYPELDARLPGGGWPKGALTELLLEHEGIGELQLLSPLMKRLTEQGQAIVWIAPPHVPYAPALARAGISIRHVVVVQTETSEDLVWSCDQALRNGGCGLVLAWPGPLRNGDIRRLQLAAEAGESLGVLMRPTVSRAQSSPAALRLILERSSPDARLTADIIKCRGAWQSGRQRIDLPPVTAGPAFTAAPTPSSSDIIQGPWH